MDSVPPSWTKRAYPSTLGLSSWFADMLNRITELSNWTVDFNVSKGKKNHNCNMREDKILEREIKSIYILLKRGKKKLNLVTLQVSKKANWQTFVVYFVLKFDFLSFDCGQSNFSRCVSFDSCHRRSGWVVFSIRSRYSPPSCSKPPVKTSGPWTKCACIAT